ncbi:MAG: hypothetical protein ACREIL_00620 [Nitrospiraceae bacterium]
MAAGAIREDDYKRNLLRELAGCSSAQNPSSQVDRPLHHFFDVQRVGSGLTVLGVEIGLPATDWALGRQGRGSANTQNQFSLPDARVYQLRSLTAPTRDERDVNTALLFRTLGQVTHVLQDMSQPEHTRNDPHAGCVEFLLGKRSWYEDYIDTRARGIAFKSRGDVSPPLVLGGYSPPSFTSYQDFWATSDRKGLADFSSRNFFSAGTNLDNCSDLPQPPCLQGAYAQRDTPFSIRTVSGGTVSGNVRLFLRNIQDPVTGAVIPEVPVSSRSVWDQHLEQRQQEPVFSLNTLVYDAIGDLLLPRAVGYSAGFLDHFFRGKLDVDVVEDLVDPSRLNLVGTNGSPEALVDGSLTVYADDPNGVRNLVTSVGVSQVESNAALPTLTFQASEDAERFVAVYQGTLGQEAKDDSRNLPGAVIGKVLGGVRVEEVFNDGVQWHLRTPQGIFPLPISGQEIERLRWGDRDNTLIGRTDFGANDPNQLVVYEIARPVGSTEVPLVSSPDGSQVVDLKVLKQVVFPVELDLQTTVNLTHTIQYQQYLMSFVHTTIFTPVECPAISCGYKISGSTVSEGQVTPLSSESHTLTRSIPLILGPGAPFEWGVAEIALTATGRILALVEVEELKVTQEKTFEAFTLIATGGADGTLQPVREPIAPVTERFSEPVGMGPLVWALVDVERGQVVASSAPGTVTINHTTASPDFHSALSGFGDARMFRKERFVGGDQNGVFRYVLSTTPWTDLPGRTCPEGEQGLDPLAELSTVDGTVVASLAQYRPELEHAHFPSMIPKAESTKLLSFLCPSQDHVSASFRLTSAVREIKPSRMERVRRAGVDSGGEQLVILVTQEQVGEDPTKFIGDSARLVVWSPERAMAEVRREFPAPAFYSLESVSSGAALVETFDFTFFPPSFTTTLSRLQGPASAVLFTGTSLFDFVLLDPEFLYNTSDFKFYRKQSPLQRTALPATLAPLNSGFNPLGAYHALRFR